MENRSTLKINRITNDQPDKRVKGLSLVGPHATSVPIAWVEFRGKILVIFETANAVVNSNLFAYDLEGKILWQAPGNLFEGPRDIYSDFAFDPERERVGAFLFSGGGVLFDEDSGEIIDQWWEK